MKMCTGIRFTDTAGNMYFARNLDWSTPYGQKVLFTPKAYERPWAYPEDHKGKTSDHSIIGMGIVADNTPLYFDCANEAGLAIAGLNFPGYAEYEKDAIAGKTNIAAWEFPLWVVSEFTTVDQVEEALKNVAIVAKQVNAQYPVSLLHWLIGDGKRSIVVEYMPDGIHVYHDDVDVLTNQPTFDWHHENLRNYISLTNEFPAPVKWRDDTLTAYGSGSGMRGIPGDFYSPSRFVRVAYLNSHYPDQTDEAACISRMFHTLTGVAMIDGGAKMGDGAFEKTIYTGGFSAKSGTYYYNTYENPAIMAASFDDCDLASSELAFPTTHIYTGA